MSRIVDQPEAYFSRFRKSDDPLLLELEAEAATEPVPIVGPVVGQMLYVLARAIHARSVLELGTATGYSTIFLARACAATGGGLTTLEIDPAMAARARRNLDRSGAGGCVEVVCGDVLGRLPGMRGPFDLIFMDIEKSDYARVLPECGRLLRPAGLLVADNVAFPEADAFNRAVFSSPDWQPVSLLAHLPGHSPEKDGVCLALRC
jgi:predicted O-methyltransferase YrrM